ncbi:hypothetical protein K438DRAFT_2132881 [Mycena galopus ATCC 62051]|nr:hypothetical protein K438DRAFT_2132881 [Mycena galopus ATCC 62051]
MSTSEFSTCIQRLLSDIGYRHEPFPLYDADYWVPFHGWMLNTLGPTSSWGPRKLAELEHAAGGIIERAYPYMSTPLKLLFAKLTAIAILIDDSIEDADVHHHLVQFSARLFRGEVQQNALLALYHANIRELSEMYGDDSVLRGLATVPWINYIDACLMEKEIFSADTALRSNCEYHSLRRARHPHHFHFPSPHYLRSKSGIAEAYAAGVFKATKEQSLPLTRYVKVIPDLTFYIVIRGRGEEGEWTAYDTLRLLCDEIREATYRIDGLLRLDECERKLRGEAGLSDIDETDIEIAMQWRGWRDGYISWHLECRRYRLGFLKLAVTGEAPEFANV